MTHPHPPPTPLPVAVQRPSPPPPGCTCGGHPLTAGLTVRLTSSPPSPLWGGQCGGPVAGCNPPPPKGLGDRPPLGTQGQQSHPCWAFSRACRGHCPRAAHGGHPLPLWPAAPPRFGGGGVFILFLVLIIGGGVSSVQPLFVNTGRQASLLALGLTRSSPSGRATHSGGQPVGPMGGLARKRTSLNQLVPLGRRAP